MYTNTYSVRDDYEVAVKNRKERESFFLDLFSREWRGCFSRGKVGFPLEMLVQICVSLHWDWKTVFVSKMSYPFLLRHFCALWRYCVHVKWVYLGFGPIKGFYTLQDKTKCSLHVHMSVGRHLTWTFYFRNCRHVLINPQVFLSSFSSFSSRSPSFLRRRRSCRL